MCGGAISIISSNAITLGLSPRVRGSLFPLVDMRVMARSIPACAGEPPEELDTVDEVRVYPRVCGGASS